ncbi:MAG: GHKL domain-containing protein [Bacillota bacterium]|nr:GHKL domain-containing protein [Bacillota bacterium]
MNISNLNLFYIITNIFDVYIIYKFMSVFFNRKDANRKVEFISYALYYFIFTSVYLFLNIPIVTLISNIVLLFIVSFNYKTSLRRRILAIALIYIILISIESIVALIFGFLDFSIFSQNSEFTSIAGMTTVKILLYITALSIGNYKNIKDKSNILYSYWFAIFFIPLMSLFIILSIIEMAPYNVYRIIFIIVNLLFINFFVFYLYDNISTQQKEKFEKLLISNQNTYYAKQLNLMKSSLESVRSFRHDMRNHLILLKSLVENNEYNEASKVISQITGAIDIKNEYAQSGNITVDSILNFKLQEAINKGISVSLELNIPERLNITPFDMSVILGNLLDNAINASSKLEKDKRLDLKIDYKRGRLFINLSNTYTGILNYKGDKLTTSNRDKEAHGIGIKNINAVLDKYDGVMEIDHTENIFTVIILLYLND